MDAATGNLVTNITAGSSSSYLDVAWDRVGNVYGTEYEVWHAFSPPGTNQATTFSVPVVQIMKSVRAPVLSDSQFVEGQFQFNLAGQSNVTYLIEATTDFLDWATVATNYSVLPLRTVQFTPMVDASFLRAMVAP